jgi:hypothetical protein
VGPIWQPLNFFYLTLCCSPAAHCYSAQPRAPLLPVRVRHDSSATRAAARSGRMRRPRCRSPAFSGHAHCPCTSGPSAQLCSQRCQQGRPLAPSLHPMWVGANGTDPHLGGIFSLGYNPFHSILHPNAPSGFSPFQPTSTLKLNIQ